MTIADLRREYTLSGINDGELDTDPIKQFKIWFDDALEAEAYEANAFTLATVNEEGTPSARVVLIKGVDANGFTFYTNHESPKAHDLEANPKCAMCFYWAQLERQVRVKGIASRVSREEAQEYFDSRPRGSRLAAWASRQSRPIASRKLLENHLREFEMEHDEQVAIPMPKWWGGYRIKPESFEFWQGRPNRLHDRFQYVQDGNAWKIERMSP